MENTPLNKTILTIGHSTRSVEEFIELLKMNRVEEVIDIRTIPRSRFNPQFNIDILPASLKTENIDYLHMSGLGGLRHPRPDSPSLGWRNASFRGFADYMQTREFGDNLNTLMGLAGKRRLVLMCAEAVPWRCHRSLIADALLIHGFRVEHIISAVDRKVHVLTPWAKVQDSHVIYPAPINSIGKGAG